MRFVLFLIGTFAAAFVSISLQRGLGVPYWGYYAISAALAVVCYAVSALLIGAFIKRRTGSFDTTDALPGVQAWELTAGTGMVPMWVSWIGLAGICFALAIPFEGIAWLLRLW